MPSLISLRRPLPKPSPQSDPRFKKVMEDLKRGAARSKHHAPAGRKAAEASAAAKGPPNEKAAAGKSAQVDKIQGAPTKNPEPASFLSVLQAEIAKAMPKTLGDTEKFMKKNSFPYGHGRIELECAVEQRLARQAHNLEVVGSIPTGAILFPPSQADHPRISGGFFALAQARGFWVRKRAFDWFGLDGASLRQAPHRVKLSWNAISSHSR